MIATYSMYKSRKIKIRKKVEASRILKDAEDAARQLHRKRKRSQAHFSEDEDESMDEEQEDEEDEEEPELEDDDGEEDEDDDVVSAGLAFALRSADRLVFARACVTLSFVLLDGQGVANDGYFLPGPAQNLELRATLIEKNSPPDILVHGLITPEDVDKLFDM